jgi:hypothetical protein
MPGMCVDEVGASLAISDILLVHAFDFSPNVSQMPQVLFFPGWQLGSEIVQELLDGLFDHDLLLGEFHGGQRSIAPEDSIPMDRNIPHGAQLFGTSFQDQYFPWSGIPTRKKVF